MYIITRADMARYVEGKEGQKVGITILSASFSVSEGRNHSKWKHFEQRGRSADNVCVSDGILSPGIRADRPVPAGTAIMGR
ncbi:MAG: hypothetical protein MR427_09995 [Roseburia sp.]|nr:hypothetical protein [Roseburia sp.]